MIALVDCNAFFCSCERLFRPDLEGKPVGVLSNNDGCFVSRTKELKSLGVPMAAPYFKYRLLCKENNVSVFSANFALYSNISHRVMQVLSKISPSLEIYSIDEAFIDLSSTPTKDLHKVASMIRAEVLREVGIPVSVGVATTKVLSKMANHLAKRSQQKDGVVILDNQQILERALVATPIEDLWGVGRKSALKLRTIGIRNAKELHDYQNENAIQRLLTKSGRMIQDELRGTPCYILNSKQEKKQQILCSRSFGRPVLSISSLRESIANFTTSAAQRLREQGSCCLQLSVFCHTSPFGNTPHYSGYDTITLDTPTSCSLKLIATAWAILDSIYRSGFEYKKAGVQLSTIVDADQVQLSLFSPVLDDKSETLMKLVDHINIKEGDGIIQSAACGTNKKSWKMKQSMRSPRYLSSWSDLPVTG
jgi:DNA polymerase V